MRAAAHKSRVGHVVGEVEKELRGTAIGIDVEQGEETLGVEPDIFVHQRKRTESHHHHKDALEEFKRSHGLKHLPLSGVQSRLVSGLGHECW